MQIGRASVRRTVHGLAIANGAAIGRRERVWCLQWKKYDFCAILVRRSAELGIFQEELSGSGPRNSTNPGGIPIICVGQRTAWPTSMQQPL